MTNKTFDFEIKNLNIDEDKNIGTIEGFASTFGNIDREGDIILKGAFRKSINTFRKKDQKVPLLANHNSEKVIGGFLPSEMVEQEKGLKVIGQVDLNTQEGRERYSLAKNGFLNSFSIGFSADPSNVTRDKKGNRIFKEVELFEVSLVAIPANPEAVITEVKEATIDKQLSFIDNMILSIKLNTLVSVQIDKFNK